MCGGECEVVGGVLAVNVGVAVCVYLSVNRCYETTTPPLRSSEPERPEPTSCILQLRLRLLRWAVKVDQLFSLKRQAAPLSRSAFKLIINISFYFG